jgi:2-polyprenyl-3-methyl-5-hydroxy-6-metoxy-1,4-benzoquinol methylase
MKSPLSEKPPEKIRDLPRKFILERLEHYYQQKPPAEIVETDYSMWRCTETGFEFAWPMRPGNLPFYKWISQFDSYYPGIRWEYGEVRKLIGSDAKVLDVGCGEGDFLKSLGGVASNRYALDMNEPAVKRCAEVGFNSFCGTIDHAVRAGFMHEGQFPVVTSFHCLEHVDDPVEFVRSMLKAVAPEGRLFVSTPYSPMSFESDWFDIMNHPPHHMTRWNLRAYKKLAELLRVKLRYFTPESTPSRRALDVFKLLRYGPHRPYKKINLAADLILRASTFARILTTQQKRAQQNDGIAADVILVEFTR